MMTAHPSESQPKPLRRGIAWRWFAPDQPPATDRSLRPDTWDGGKRVASNMLLAYPGAVTWQVIMQGVGSGMSAVATIVRCGPRHRRHVRHGPCCGNPPTAGVIVRTDDPRHCRRNHLNGHDSSGDRPGGAQHTALPHRQAAAQPGYSPQPGHDLKHRRHGHENLRRRAGNHRIPRHDDRLSHRRDRRYRPHIPDDRPAAARGCAVDRRCRGTHREAHHQGVRSPPPGRGRACQPCYRRCPRLPRG